MAATPKRSLVVQVAFTIKPDDPDANQGRMVDALMAALDDLELIGSECGFTLTNTRWQRTTYTEASA